MNTINTIDAIIFSVLCLLIYAITVRPTFPKITKDNVKDEKDPSEIRKECTSFLFEELALAGLLQRTETLDSIQNDVDWFEISYDKTLLFFELERDGDKYWSLDGKEWYKLK